jgi:hypothetical protein
MTVIGNEIALVCQSLRVMVSDVYPVPLSKCS